MICYVCTIVQHALNVLLKRLHLCLLCVLGLMSVSCQFSQFVLFYDLIPFMYWSHLTDLQCVLVQCCEYVWTPSTAHPSRNPSQGSQFFLYCSLRGIWLSGCFESPSASNRNVLNYVSFTTHVAQRDFIQVLSLRSRIFLCLAQGGLRFNGFPFVLPVKE